MVNTVRDPETAHLPDERLRACLCTALDCAEDLQVISRTRVPSFHHDLEIVQVSLPAGGRQRRNIEVFVRIYRGRLCWSDVARCDLPEREWTAWKIAQRADIPLPRTVSSGWLDDTALAIQQRVPGKSLRKLGTLASMRDCGEILARLHQLEFGDEDRRHLADARLAPLLEQLTELATETGHALCQRAVRLLCMQAAAVDERTSVFLHGDFHPWNVLTEGREVTGVIDWEESSYGDPRLDLAMMDMYLRLCNRFDGWCRRRRNRQRADTFLSSYREASGWDPGSLVFWKRLIDVRELVVGRWINHRAESQLPFPYTNPASWSHAAEQAARRVGRWVNS